MVDVPLYDAEGKSAGTVSVDERLFGRRVNLQTLHAAVRMYEANRRRGTHNTLTRGEVEGSTRKPWKQKHTGRARVGTIRSPIWVKGGIIHGPHPRDYSYTIPKKMRRTALDSAILGKLLDKEVAVIEALRVEAPKTSRVAGLLKTMKIDRSCLIALPAFDGKKAEDRNLLLSVRNLPRVRMEPLGSINAREVLRHRTLLLTRGSLDALVSARKPAAAAAPAKAGKTGKAAKAAGSAA